jgi:hypothetical protein
MEYHRLKYEILRSEGGKEYPTYNKRRKPNWISHILRRNCFLKHLIEGKIEERLEVTRRRGRRRNQILDKRKETSEYWELKKEALDRTLWRTRYGRFHRSVVRQTTE